MNCSQCHMDVERLSDREGHKMDCSRPSVSVHLSTGQDSNIFMILGAVRRAMRQAGLLEPELDAFTEDLTSSENYDKALQCVMRWVHVT